MANTYFLDLETTGLDIMHDRVIEIAIVNFDNPDDHFESYVNPGMPISQVVSEVTGITDSLVADKPSLAEIAPQILEKLKNAECIGGHNVLRYDLPLLINDLRRNDVDFELPADFKVMDTLTVERALTAHNLGATYRRYYGQDFTGWHGAMADTKASIAIAKAQQQAILDQNSNAVMTTTVGVDVNGLVALNAEGVLIWTFGKYRNQPVTFDRQYAKWVLANDFPASTKKLVRDTLLTSMTCVK